MGLNMRYLKNEQYYIDLYDLTTVKDCLWSISYWKKAYQEKKQEKGIDQKALLEVCSRALNYALYIRKTEDYRKKKEYISKWMQKDQILQDKYEMTNPPDNIYCPSCGYEMVVQDKHLENYSDEPLRLLFFFECPSCKKRQGVYENGERRVSKPQLCPKCSSAIVVSFTEKKKVVARITSCTSCIYTEKEEDDFDNWKKYRDKEYRQDAALLEKHRAEFCLTEAEGKKHIEGLDNLKRLSEYIDNWKKEQKDPNYQKAMRIKKLSVIEIENKITKAIAKAKFIKLSLNKPEIGRHVIVPFTIQDGDASRDEYTSRITLQKTIKSSLKGTNWKLMSDGITYRLGFLSGRLRGVETKDDLVEIVHTSQEEDFIY